MSHPAESHEAPAHPAQHGQRPAFAQVEATLVPESGWHFLHLFYRTARAALAALSPDDRRRGREEVAAALDRSFPTAPEQLQGFSMVGHKADFGVVMAGPDLEKIQAVQTAIQASGLGP